MARQLKVRLAVYDVLGEVTFSRPDLCSGVCFYDLQSGGQVITKKMALLK